MPEKSVRDGIRTTLRFIRGVAFVAVFGWTGAPW